MSAPTRTRTTDETQGVYRIDSWRVGMPSAGFGLRELRSEIETVKTPRTTFASADYPSADPDIFGEYIPIAFGVVRGAIGFLIDGSTNTFKFTDHGWVRGLAFYDENQEAFTPDVIDLVNGEITYSGWDGEEQIYADFEADGSNPIDALKLLLTDTTRGAGIPVAELDTASSGKGFGTSGARLDYIVGTVKLTGEDALTLPIALYVDDSKTVAKLIQEVAATAFAILYIDRAGLYQVRAWHPEPSEGLPIITKEKMRAPPSITRNASKPITKVLARYARNDGLDSERLKTVEDDQLRQLRGLQEHAILDKLIPIATRFGANEWGERTLQIRGRPQRIFALRTIQEFMTLEPGEFVRVVYAPLNINEVVEVLSVNTQPGRMDVDLTCTDIRSWRDHSGYWTADSPAFPTSLGGASITAWDDTWSDAQADWARENLGFWLDDDGYADATDDPLRSFGGSQWF